MKLKEGMIFKKTSDIMFSKTFHITVISLINELVTYKYQDLQNKNFKGELKLKTKEFKKFVKNCEIVF